jgi:hypothetical protein
MRLILLGLTLPLTLSMAGLTARAQEAIDLPRIGVIDFYGRHAVPEAKLLTAMGLKVGSTLPPSKEDIEEKLQAVPGVVAAHLEATCCDANQVVLYVGIEERGAPHLEYNAVPTTEDLLLPEEIHREYEGFLAAVALAVRTGNTDEDLSAGHSLMKHTGARVHQLRFIKLAEENSIAIRKVLRNSADNEQRAIAAYVLGYAPNKAAVADDLQWAIRDPDPTVRNNAMRALAAFSVLALKDPNSGLKVPATWFVEALNSLDWQDRVTAANILVTLTEGRNAAIFEQIRERALPALVEMAGWKTLPQALPAFLVLGRMASLAETEIQDKWSEGKRAEVLAKFTTPPAKK